MNCTFAKNADKGLNEIRKMSHPFEDDLLQRKDLAQSLVQIIKNTKSPYVYNINSPYGTGKTFFLKRLKVLLEKADCLSIIYNSWESDDSTLPLIPLVEEILNEINTVKQRSSKNKIKKIGNEILENLEAATKALVSETWKLAFPFLDRVTRTASKYKQSKQLSIKPVQQYTELKRYKQLFKEALTNITSKLEHPLVIIIDELDRCRPNYAVETLETIKHLFDVPNLVFVLAMDRKQIESAVSVLYGHGIEENCSEYLRKFIDYDFYLPTPTPKSFIQVLVNTHLMPLIEKFIENLIVPNQRFYRILIPIYTGKRYSSKEIFDYLVNLINITCSFFRFSLRAQEQFVLQIRIFLSALDPKTDYLFPDLFILPMGLNFFSHEHFEDFVHTDASLLMYFEFSQHEAQNGKNSWFRLAYSKNLDTTIWEKFNARYEYGKTHIVEIVQKIIKLQVAREYIQLSFENYEMSIQMSEFTAIGQKYMKLIEQLHINSPDLVEAQDKKTQSTYYIAEEGYSL